MCFFRNIYALACTLIILAAFFAGGCTENLEPLPGTGYESEVVLHLNTGSSFSRTRANETDGKDSVGQDLLATMNEEAIRRVDLFFFKSDANGQRIEGRDEKLFYVCELKREDVTTADVSVKLPVELAEMFTQSGSGNDYRAYVYALVNLPETIVIDENKKTIGGKSVTFDSLQELWVSTSSFTAKGGPSDFVMRGGAPIMMVKEGRYFSASGTIMLERLASKIRLWAAIPQTIYIDRETGKTISRDQFENGAQGDADYANAIADADIWHPVTIDRDPETGTEKSTVGLYLYNLATNGRIDAAVSNGLTYADIDRDPKFEEVVRRLEEIQAPDEGAQLPEQIYDQDYPYTHTLAYYSYPNQWINSASEDNHQTYLMIRLPWQKEVPGGGFEIQNFYYQIPVNVLKSTDGRKENCLEPNRYYRVKIKIGMLGSKDMGDPLEVDASCEVVPWQTADVDVSIKGRRYLVVNQTEWTMNNVWTLEIPFSSSHPVEIEACYVNYFRYKDLWGTASDTKSTHNYTEFDKWLEEAKKLPGGQGGEGKIKIESDFTTYTEVTERIKGGAAIGAGYRDKVITHKNTYRINEETLYYKHKYFYDDVLGYKYYVGHEHPITFHDEGIAFPKNVELSEKESKAWEEYKRKYNDIDSVYTYSVDNSRNVIKFSHPLVQWTPVRDEILTNSTDEVFDSWDIGAGYYHDTREYDVSTVKYYYPLCDIDGKLEDEFSRCEIIIMVKHVGYNNADDLFRDTIHITQYPGMYIEVSHNYGAVKEKKTVDNETGNAYTKVNGKVKHTNGQWNDVNELEDFAETSSNVNPNMYVIHTTQLAEDKQDIYIIGDPRTLNYNNDLSTEADPNKARTKEEKHGYDYPLVDSQQDADNNKWKGRNDATGKTYDDDIADAKSIYNSGRELTRYYPTDESSGVGSKENFIAPAFRVASSFGKVTINGRTEMRRRCAAYQEAGRPAGRWRVPTKAEVMYIATLSAEGKIPVLFGSVESKTKDGYYWCAQGGLTVNGAGKCEDNSYGDANNNYPPGCMAVRCVYDEWYWTQIDGGEFPKGLSATTTDFYWGDKEKDNPQAPAPTVLRTPSFSTKK